MQHVKCTYFISLKLLIHNENVFLCCNMPQKNSGLVFPIQNFISDRIEKIKFIKIVPRYTYNSKCRISCTFFEMQNCLPIVVHFISDSKAYAKE